MRGFLALLAVAVGLSGCLGEEEGVCQDGGMDEVDQIVDGDTLDGRACGRIRLALVDTPERGEAGNDEAAAFTEGTCPPRSAMRVHLDDGQPWDATGTRRVAMVACEGGNLNARLIDERLAVILVEYCDVSEFSNEAWAEPYCSGV